MTSVLHLPRNWLPLYAADIFTAKDSVPSYVLMNQCRLNPIFLKTTTAPELMISQPSPTRWNSPSPPKSFQRKQPFQLPVFIGKKGQQPRKQLSRAQNHDSTEFSSSELGGGLKAKKKATPFKKHHRRSRPLSSKEDYQAMMMMKGICASSKRNLRRRHYAKSAAEFESCIQQVWL
jgi:hypothetical protein